MSAKIEKAEENGGWGAKMEDGELKWRRGAQMEEGSSNEVRSS